MTIQAPERLLYLSNPEGFIILFRKGREIQPFHLPRAAP